MRTPIYYILFALLFASCSSGNTEVSLDNFKPEKLTGEYLVTFEVADTIKSKVREAFSDTTGSTAEQLGSSIGAAFVTYLISIVESLKADVIVKSDRTFEGVYKTPYGNNDIVGNYIIENDSIIINVKGKKEDSKPSRLAFALNGGTYDNLELQTTANNKAINMNIVKKADK